MNSISKIVEPWLSDIDSDDLITLRDHLIWLQKELFNEYEPHQYESFDDRLGEWLKNVDDGDDRKSLFRLLDHLFFVGKQQFDSLCRAAFCDQVIKWVIDECALDVSSDQLQVQLGAAVRRTWFCPVTDSMRINAFLKLNGLGGHTHRPDWFTLQILSDPARVQGYMDAQRIERLVLLEDFVGSGNQTRSTVEWAATTFASLPILFVPLVCCPEGIKTGLDLEAAHANVTFAPTLSLRPELFVHETAQIDEPNVFARVRELIVRIAARLGNWQTQPFGYEGTGALVALYSNCPDNTLPIVHHRGASWSPLFSRVDRS